MTTTTTTNDLTTILAETTTPELLRFLDALAHAVRRTGKHAFLLLDDVEGGIVQPAIDARCAAHDAAGPPSMGHIEFDPSTYDRQQLDAACRALYRPASGDDATAIAKHLRSVLLTEAARRRGCKRCVW